jgi:RNA polymerase sigma factor (sigma-70 family)
MRPVAAPARLRRATSKLASWDERAARFFTELEAPAKAMVRRAYRDAFGDDELDDIYNGAWVGTLRALAGRHQDLTDKEIRSYVFTAVAHQAGKEIRRRKRRPTAPLDHAAAVADSSPAPEDRADQNEDSRVTRDLLASLPRRRRAVLMLRYGWGLDPEQVCELLKGLSPRAYRKEITRGIDELTERIRRFEAGEWCADREPILKAYAAGIADSDQQVQAQQHLSHCRSCSEFVGRLSGHLHDLGGALAVPGAVDAVGGGHIGVADRLGELADRVREPVGSLLGRGGSQVAEPASQVSSTGGLKGAGAAGAGVAAKLAGIGTAGKIAVACLGGGAAATACVAAGVVPLGVGDDRAPRQARAAQPAVDADSQRHLERLAHELYTPPEGSPEPEPQPPPEPAPTPPPPEPAPPPVPAGEQDLGLAPVSSSSPAPSPSANRGQAGASQFGP